MMFALDEKKSHLSTVSRYSQDCAAGWVQRGRDPGPGAEGQEPRDRYNVAGILGQLQWGRGTGAGTLW